MRTGRGRPPDSVEKGSSGAARESAMTKGPKLTRWDAVWAAGAVALFLVFAVAARTPFFDLVRLLFAGVVVALCIADWRAKGHGWLPTLSWTVPLGGLWMLAQWIVDGPIVLVVLIYWLGFVSYNQMLWMSIADMEAAYPPE